MPLFYPVKGKNLLYPLADFCLLPLALAVSLGLALFPVGGDGNRAAGPLPFLVTGCIYTAVFYLFQIYRVMWIYSNIKDFYRLMAASSTAFLLAFSLAWFVGLMVSPPVLAIFFLLSTVLTAGYRILIRDYLSRYGDDLPVIEGGPKGNRIVIAGAGEAGRLILSEYLRMGRGGEIVGFVDDDPAKTGIMLNGKMIFGTTDSLPDVIRSRDINQVLIAMPSAGEESLKRITSRLGQLHPGLSVKLLPPFTRLFNSPLTPDIREIGIGDILDREEISIDISSIEGIFAGSTVLITGAGGSIGSELCRQLLKFRIRKLIALGRGEDSIYQLIRNLNEYKVYLDYDPELIYRIGDVRNRERLEALFREHKPDIVLHAAAHKHVPLMEFNEIEALENNVLGTRNVLDVSRAHDVRRFVLISTDKAVYPSSVMGASKRAAELVSLYYYREKGLKTAVVRFGNVLGSRGSVIPLFREQIEKGGPVTVTHPDVERYFMSIPEASLLVLNAAAYSRGGEVFLLEMGRSYRIAEIARRLIRLYGLRPDGDISIKYTGLRPGEKLHEELSYSEDKLLKTGNEKIRILSEENSGYGREIVETFLDQAADLVKGGCVFSPRELLKRLVPDYQSQDTEDSSPPPEKYIS